MQAIIFDQPGSADVLQLGDVPMPTFGDDDLLIRVRATALNRADILQRRGMYPPPAGASPILGLEIAGEIAACGANVTDWHVGDRVCALLAGGGYAEYVAIPAAMAMQIPDNLTFEQAAAIPEAWITAYDNLFNWGKLAAGENVLIHGGSSGIGTAAIQLARWCGATPFVTVGSDEKAHACKQLGANAINYRSHKWVTELERLSNGQGVNVILDIIGAKYFADNLKSLSIEGRLVVIATMGGATSELDLRTIMSKRLKIMGTTLRARPLTNKIALTRQIEHEILPRFADGTLQPIIHAVYDLTDAGHAHEVMESSLHVGKIVLRVF